MSLSNEQVEARETVAAAYAAEIKRCNCYVLPAVIDRRYRADRTAASSFRFFRARAAPGKWERAGHWLKDLLRLAR